VPGAPSCLQPRGVRCLVAYGATSTVSDALAQVWDASAIFNMLVMSRRCRESLEYNSNFRRL